MDVDLSKELASSSKSVVKNRLDTSKSEAKKQMVRSQFDKATLLFLYVSEVYSFLSISLE
jgi:hypothetical protein